MAVHALVPLEKPRLARWSMMPLYGYFSEPMKTRLCLIRNVGGQSAGLRTVPKCVGNLNHRRLCGGWISVLYIRSGRMTDFRWPRQSSRSRWVLYACQRMIRAGLKSHTFIVQMYDAQAGFATFPLGDDNVGVLDFDSPDEVEVSKLLRWARH